MTAYELAEKLLGGPDYRVLIPDYEFGILDEVLDPKESTASPIEKPNGWLEECSPHPEAYPCIILEHF